ANLWGDFAWPGLVYPGPVEDRDGDQRLGSSEFFPMSLDCWICGLRLEGNDELRAAGVKGSWLNPSIAREWVMGAMYDYEPVAELPPEGADLLDWSDWPNM